MFLVGLPQFGLPTDPYFSSVELLLHGNGPDGSAAVDSSSHGYAITKGGDAGVSTAQFKFNGGSLAFDGTGDYLTSDNSFTAPGSGDMTVEFWMRPGNVSKQQCVLDFRAANGDFELRIDFNNTFDGGAVAGVLMYVRDAGRATTTALTINVWYHVAAVRASGVWRLYLNGAQAGFPANDSTFYTRRRFTLGTYFDDRGSGTNYKFQGYIDDFRLTHGVARYTGSSFVLPIDQYPDR